jgi:signal transduction histidine kinase
MDLALGGACLALAVAVHLGGSQAVSRNLEPSAFSVLLTTLAVGPLVVRRRYPVAVLALTLAGVLLLVATRNTVGIATVGCTVAFYTAVAVVPRPQVPVAVVLMTVGVAAGLAMRPVDLSPGGALVNLLIFGGAGVLGTSVRQRRERHEAEIVSAQARTARSAAEERLRITRELHDILGHAMSVMVVQAGVAERLIGTDPERARTAVVEIGTTGRRSLAEVRQLIATLRDGDADPQQALPREPVPTLAELPGLVARVEAAGLPVTLTMHGAPGPLPPGLELAAYRVVQEALTNCLKHAHATRAQVDVVHDDGEVRVAVVDDGRARPGDRAPDGTTGQGLVGMRERVAVYHGRLSAGPGARGGFRVDATFPAGPP